MKLFRFTSIFIFLTIAGAALPSYAGIGSWFTQKAQSYPNGTTAVLLGSMFTIMGLCKYKHDQLNVHRERVSDIPFDPRSKKSKLKFTTPDLNKEDLLKEIKALKEKFIAHKKIPNHHQTQFQMADSDIELITEFDKHCAQFDTQCYTRKDNEKVENAKKITVFVSLLNDKEKSQRSLAEYDELLNQAISFMEKLEYHCDFESLDQNQEGMVTLGTLAFLAAAFGTLYIHALGT